MLIFINTFILVIKIFSKFANRYYYLAYKNVSNQRSQLTIFYIKLNYHFDM